MTEQPGVIHSARRELRRIGGRPLYPMLLFILPLLSFALLWVIFSAGTVRDLPIAVVDMDRSRLSRQLVRMLDATPSMAVARRVDSGQAAEELLLTGQVYGVVLIPGQFERDVLRDGQPVVTLYRNSQFMLPSSSIRRETLAATGTLSAGIELRQRMARGETQHQAGERFEPLRAEARALFNPWLNYIYFLVSSLLPTLLQIFIMVMAVHAVGVELKDGTGREWLDAGGGSVIRALAGKLLPYTVAYLLLGLFMLFLLLVVLDMPFHGSLPVLVAGTALFVLACLGLGVLLSALFANLRFATSAAAFLASPAFAFAGLTFPISAMPPFAVAWANLLPLTHYLQVLVEQLMRGASPVTSLAGISILAGFAALTLLVSLPRLDRVLSDERYWRRT